MSTPNLRFFSFSLFFLADMNDHHLTFELADLQFDTIVIPFYARSITLATATGLRSYIRARARAGSKRMKPNFSLLIPVHAPFTQMCPQNDENDAH
jgi:hypothetical protein